MLQREMAPHVAHTSKHDPTLVTTCISICFYLPHIPLLARNEHAKKGINLAGIEF